MFHFYWWISYFFIHATKMKISFKFRYKYDNVCCQRTRFDDILTMMDHSAISLITLYYKYWDQTGKIMLSLLQRLSHLLTSSLQFLCQWYFVESINPIGLLLFFLNLRHMKYFQENKLRISTSVTRLQLI